MDSLMFLLCPCVVPLLYEVPLLLSNSNYEATCEKTTFRSSTYTRQKRENNSKNNMHPNVYNI